MNYPAPILNKTLGEVDAIVRQFVETGIAYFESDFTDGTPYRSRIMTPTAFGMSKLLRTAARQMKRPYVKVERVTNVTWHQDKATGRWRPADGTTSVHCDVTIPKLKRTAPLFAPLFLAADVDTGDTWRSRAPAPPVRYFDRFKTVHYFKFSGDAGVKQFDYWLEQCRTDPAFRKALGTD